MSDDLDFKKSLQAWGRAEPTDLQVQRWMKVVREERTSIQQRKHKSIWVQMSAVAAALFVGVFIGRVSVASKNSGETDLASATIEIIHNKGE